MATVDITLASAQSRATHGGTLPVVDPAQVDTDVITSSGASQQSDFAVPAAATGLIWLITNAGTENVRALFGQNPTAVAAEGGGWLILAGTTREFGAIAGDKVAIINA